MGRSAKDTRETVAMLDRVSRLGISRDDAKALRRISMTLHRWYEAECNGEIERDETRGGMPWSAYQGALRFRVPDRERGAQKRLAAIMARYPGLTAYVQTDPRGCALYIIEAARLPADASIDSCYSSVGVAVFA